MAEVRQPGWTQLLTPNGRYEYQFQGRSPCVREGRYEDASDYQFLVMNEEGWLFRIPVRMSAGAEEGVRKNNTADAASDSPLEVRIAEAQLRAGLQTYQPRQNAPFPEFDEHFSVDAARARELAAQLD